MFSFSDFLLIFAFFLGINVNILFLQHSKKKKKRSSVTVNTDVLHQSVLANVVYVSLTLASHLLLFWAIFTLSGEYKENILFVCFSVCLNVLHYKKCVWHVKCADC